jgi:RNA-directed DNA polymerase
VPTRYRDGIRALMQPLTDQGAPPALSVGVVATLFGLSIPFVRAMSKNPGRYYRVFTIRKGKKARKISAPKVALKLLQSWIGWHLSRAVELNECVLGFVPEKNGVIEAAKRHCSARWVYSLDLRDFFPSIHSERVEAALCALGYPAQSAAFIRSLCTLNGALPQGSPASPVLSNLVFTDTDIALFRLANEYGVRYTRYADDLVFSGEGEVPFQLQEGVRSVLKAHGWVIAEEKEHLVELPKRLKVHGLLVHGNAPRMTKGYRNRIRAYRHLLAIGKIKSEDLAKVKGHLSYASQVDQA